MAGNTKRAKKKSALNMPMLILSAIFLLVFVAGIGVTIRNIVVFSKVPAEVVEPVESDKTLKQGVNGQSVIGTVVVRDGGTQYLQDMKEWFKPLYAANNDTIGWIKIPGTSIDTVVVQNDDDNGKTGEYRYLKNDFYGEFTKYGNVFLDFRCNKYTPSTNTILYGHTTEDGQQVFLDIEKYEDPEFFKKYPIIEYSTLYNNYKWKVFGIFATTTNASDDNGYVFDYIYPNMSEADMVGYLEQVDERVMYHTGVDVAPTDKILTLSTCSYNYHVNGKRITARLVLVARMLRDGESEEINPSLVTDNPDYRRPQAWYDAVGQSNPYINSVQWKPQG
ncbi:MAG: class B sortase [Clostridia bacterium]|nr:class B sortase [Clostridia bacterium]